MKNLWILATICILSALTVTYAQSPKEINKEQKEITKYAQKELDRKASKIARKEAKKLKKEGWLVTPGALPLEKQLDRSYIMQSEYESPGYQRYIMAEAMSIGENYDAAKIQASELAKLNLVTQIQSDIQSTIESSIGNQQLSGDEAASISQIIAASRNTIAQRLGRVIMVVEAYRTLANRNKEVLVRIAYNGEIAKDLAKQVIREDLMQKSEDLMQKFDLATKGK